MYLLCLNAQLLRFVVDDKVKGKAMDDTNAQQQRENQSRFQDLCNSELVDKAATLAAAAMLAADIQKESENKQQQNVFHSPERRVSPPQNVFRSPEKRVSPPMLAEATEELYFPSREEREAFGNRVRRSPSYYAAVPQPLPISGIERTFSAPLDGADDEEEEEEEEVEHPLHKTPEVPPAKEEACGISTKDIAELKEEAHSQAQWDTGSVYEEEEQLTKVCYLVKIDELKEEGIPMYKAVDIDSDIATIKLCHAFMNERANRKKLLKRGKGAAKFTADIFGKVSDFFQKNEGDDDSTEWRNHFKSDVEHGIHDIPIRKVMDKYENFHPPEEVTILELMWESKTKFDDQRKKQKKIEQEKALKGHEQTLNGWENYISSLKLQDKE
jgi:hypothetical protein